MIASLLMMGCAAIEPGAGGDPGARGGRRDSLTELADLALTSSQRKPAGEPADEFS